MNNYKNLIVWQKAMDMVINIYKATDKFPDKERFGLISQMNRCGVSIASNIAEGAGRNSPKEFNNFLGISLASTCELETQLLISEKLKYISKSDMDGICSSINEIQKMIYSLQKNLKK